MSVAVVIVGIDGWEEYTLPCIQSIGDSDPRAGIVVVDNGSKPRYPIPVGVGSMTAKETLCYAGAINTGMCWMGGVEFDWIVVVNNDVLFNKPFVNRVLKLNPKQLHGFEKHSIFDRPYLCGWALMFHVSLLDKVGEFDEHFAIKYFEDADYSFRAVDAGYGLKPHEAEEWGIRHLHEEEEMHEARKALRDTYERNKNYLKVKHDV